MDDLQYYINRGKYLKKLHGDRNELFEGIDRMIHLEWDLPEELKATGWVSKEVAPDMRQSFMGAKRILSDNEPRISIKPYNDDPESRKLADAHEKGVQWLLYSASRRRKSTIVDDCNDSALRYGAIAAEVIFIPEQVKAVQSARGKLRAQNAKRRGDFVIKFWNPGAVYPRVSDFGLEEIYVEVETDPAEVYDNWGQHADAMYQYVLARNEGEDSSLQIDSVVFHNYLSWDRHVVWCTAGGEKFEIVNDEWLWPFLPWAYRQSGSSIETDDIFEYDSLLSDAYHSDLFDLMCRVTSLRFSEMIRYAGSSKAYFQSDTRTQPDQDASSAELMLHIEEDEKLGSLNPPMPDPGMTILHQELKQSHQASTLSHLLLGGEFPTQAAFASINLISHSALQVVKPPRQLTEETLAEVAEKMLLWIHYSGKDVTTWVTNKKTKESSQVQIEASSINPDALIIEVSLEADVPTDRRERAATAGAMIDRGVIARRTAMEDIGIRDIQDEEDLIIEERLLDNMIANQLENERMLNNIAIRQQIEAEIMAKLNAQFQQQMAQGGMAQRGAPGGAPPQGITSPGSTMGEQIMEPGVEGVPGELLNPAEGGAIPAEFAPEQTREMQTGKTATGEEVAMI